MKKGLTMLVAAIVVLGLICVIVSAAANDKNIGSVFTVKGTGLIDASLEVNTADSYSGLALSQYVYTPSLGMGGPSYLEYTSEFELGMYNVTGENRTHDLTYTEDGIVSNVRHSMSIKNYAIGSVMGFKYTGNGSQVVEAYADNSLSEIAIEGQIEGKMKVYQRVRDPKTRVDLSREMNELIGKYGYSFNANAEEYNYPASDLNGDWLGCP